jgi:hypothetical protein
MGVLKLEKIVNRLAFLACVIVLLGGCQNVAPFERGILAKPEMAFEPNPQHANLKRQVYYSKEAASGGAATAGAGCGCN